MTLKRHERQSYWLLIGLLVGANAILLLSIWFIGAAQRRDCERYGRTWLDDVMVNCEVRDVK